MGSQTYKYTDHLQEKGGYMYCEGVRVRDLQNQLSERLEHSSPFFMYSKAQVLKDINTYRNSLDETDTRYLLGFSMKANHNISLLRIFKENGLTAVAVSGNEMIIGIQSGFAPENIVFNGNGKQEWEIEIAVRNNCLINVDSEFDLTHISAKAASLKKVARVLLRINPDIDTNVHPYLATGVSSSKFGLGEHDVSGGLLKQIKCNPNLELVGLHCHLGSTIDNTSVFSECLDVMLNITDRVNKEGFSLQYLNLGGGLGIDYTKHMPTGRDLIERVRDRLVESNMCLILEPGRSLIGQAATLITTVIGHKTNCDKSYLVIDGSMNEVIRPSMYGAYHHIELTEPSSIKNAKRTKFHVVGPVCECADFLGEDRWLTEPHEGCGVAVFDTGAYCASMASNYNLRMRPAEVLVDGEDWKIIRYPDTLENLLKCYVE